MRKIVSGILLVLILTFTCFALAGRGSNNTADNSEPQGDPYIEEGEPGNESGDEKETKDHQDTGNSKNNVEKDENGLYVYKLCNEAVEIHINTNVWDYIDGDNVWDATRMAADLGFTNPVYCDKQINGFESENKMYKVIIWNDYEGSNVNSYKLSPADTFSIIYGSERGDGGSINMDIVNVIITDNQFRERAQYGMKDSNVKGLGYMVGVSFETIVFTAAGMEECNGTIPESTISDSLVIYLFSPGTSTYVIP